MYEIVRLHNVIDLLELPFDFRYNDQTLESKVQNENIFKVQDI